MRHKEFLECIKVFRFFDVDWYFHAEYKDESGSYIGQGKTLPAALKDLAEVLKNV